jgi:hypothetical protein
MPDEDAEIGYDHSCCAQGDVTQAESMRKAFKGAKAIVFCAAAKDGDLVEHSVNRCESFHFHLFRLSSWSFLCAQDDLLSQTSRP